MFNSRNGLAGPGKPAVDNDFDEEVSFFGIFLEGDLFETEVEVIGLFLVDHHVGKLEFKTVTAALRLPIPLRVCLDVDVNLFIQSFQQFGLHLDHCRFDLSLAVGAENYSLADGDVDVLVGSEGNDRFEIFEVGEGEADGSGSGGAQGHLDQQPELLVFDLHPMSNNNKRIIKRTAPRRGRRNLQAAPGL